MPQLMQKESLAASEEKIYRTLLIDVKPRWKPTWIAVSIILR
jgi:hypothetical protein